MKPLFRIGRWMVVPAADDEAVLVGPGGVRRHYTLASSARRAARLYHQDDLRLQQAAAEIADDEGYDEDKPSTAAIVRRWHQGRRLSRAARRAAGGVA